MVQHRERGALVARLARVGQDDGRLPQPVVPGLAADSSC
jgi:hypothetical protein